jgi:hypothetical protein
MVVSRRQAEVRPCRLKRVSAANPVPKAPIASAKLWHQRVQILDEAHGVPAIAGHRCTSSVVTPRPRRTRHPLLDETTWSDE